MEIQKESLYNLSYGLFVLTAKEGNKDNGCIINTAIQVASKSEKISIAVNKQNYTHDMIAKTGEFNLSIINEKAPFSLFQQFGFSSGKDTDKFKDSTITLRSSNGIIFLTEYTNSYISCKVTDIVDCGSHTLFVAEITEAKVFDKTPSMTYSYYFENVKPKPQNKTTINNLWVCKICGYGYDESVEKVKFEDLPDDWACPICKHPKSDFELQ